MDNERDWIKELLESKTKRDQGLVEIERDWEREGNHEDGWMQKREYKNASEVVDDIQYIIDEYSKKEHLDPTDLDMYFYKRDYLQRKLNEFYADEYVLVDKFCQPQKRFKYGMGAEEIITKLASDLDCFVVLKKDNRYFAEVGDRTIDLGSWPDINKLDEENNGEQ